MHETQHVTVHKNTNTKLHKNTIKHSKNIRTECRDKANAAHLYTFVMKKLLL